VKVGDRFKNPIIEFSSKLESTDRYMSYPEVAAKAGLSSKEFLELKDTATLLALRLKDSIGELGVDLLDGKFEFAFAVQKNSRERTFTLVDAIGPDELRLSYKGVQLSKENLRIYYRRTPWYDSLKKAKETALARGVKDWKKICKEELKSFPDPLPAGQKYAISMIYQTLSNALAEHSLDQKIFPEALSLEKLAQILKEANLCE